MTPQRPRETRRPAARPVEPGDPRWALRPLARVARIAVIEREVSERLSRAALDLLFDRVEVISEGQRTARAGREVYLGSTMLTFDLASLGAAFREPCDAGTARRVAGLFRDDPVAVARVRAVATEEVARVAGAAPASVDTELVVHAQGTKVFVDVDVEAAL